MSHKVLLADDNQDVRLALSMNLEADGFLVTTAEDGQIAIDKFEKDDFDVVIVDLSMPNKNGVETVAEIRKVNAAIPIFIITAFFEEFSQALAILRNSGAHFDLIKKPVHPETLIETLNDIL